VIRLDAESGDVGVGGNGQDGDLVLFPSSVKASNPAADKTKATIHLRASTGSIRSGGGGLAGEVLTLAPDGQATIHLRASSGTVSCGAGGVDGEILVMGKDGTTKIHMLASTGDIILANADCAEEFDVIEAELVDPGSVMVLDGTGKLRVSSHEYDRKVAGIISGAGSYKPGIVLDRQAVSEARLPIALVGKVYCKVDAGFSPIEVGDLLTTSPTPGHAMKASDPLKAFGAVLGKALWPLADGCGLIPVLVGLQ
jgi:hypothetical protein